MPGYRLSQGMHLELRGREYVVEKRLPSEELQLKDVASETCIAVTDAELQDAYVRQSLRFLGDSRSTAAQRKAVCEFVKDLNVLPKNDPRKKVMDRRFAYVQALLERNLLYPSPGDIKRAVEEI